MMMKFYLMKEEETGNKASYDYDIKSSSWKDFFSITNMENLTLSPNIKKEEKELLIAVFQLIGFSKMEELSPLHKEEMELICKTGTAKSVINLRKEKEDAKRMEEIAAKEKKQKEKKRKEELFSFISDLILEGQSYEEICKIIRYEPIFFQVSPEEAYLRRYENECLAQKATINRWVNILRDINDTSLEPIIEEILLKEKEKLQKIENFSDKEKIDYGFVTLCCSNGYFPGEEIPEKEDEDIWYDMEEKYINHSDFIFLKYEEPEEGDYCISSYKKNSYIYYND